jgi:hypothetical protein
MQAPNLQAHWQAHLQAHIQQDGAYQTGTDGKLYDETNFDGKRVWFQLHPLVADYTEEKAREYLNAVAASNSPNLLRPISHGGPIEHNGEKYYWSVFPLADELPNPPSEQHVREARRGLEDLHGLGLSHGDVKKENCMLYNGQVVWIDYDRGRRDVTKLAIELLQFEANFQQELFVERLLQEQGY